MAWEDFLDHECDIYHVKKKSTSIGYGLIDDSNFEYPDEPDESEIACHFHLKQGGIQIVQEEPMSELQGAIKLSLPAGTDIRKNDRIVTRKGIETGLEFRADLPRSVHNNHHIVVYIRREKGEKGAI